MTTAIETEIRRAAGYRKTAADRLNAANIKLAEAIRHAYAQGMTGPAIAVIAGLSPQRIHQILHGRR